MKLVKYVKKLLSLSLCFAMLFCNTGVALASEADNTENTEGMEEQPSDKLAALLEEKNPVGNGNGQIFADNHLTMSSDISNTRVVKAEDRVDTRYYMQVRVYVDNGDSYVEMSPEEGSYLEYVPTGSWYEQTLTITPATGYLVTDVKGRNNVSEYAKESMFSYTDGIDDESKKEHGIRTYNQNYYISHAPYDDGNQYVDYIDVYLSSPVYFNVDMFNYKDGDKGVSAANKAAADKAQISGYVAFNTGGGSSDWNKNHSKGAMQGLIKDTAAGLPAFWYGAADLFDTQKNTYQDKNKIYVYKKSYQDVAFPFIYSASNNYYEFDSAKYDSAYNSAANQVGITRYSGTNTVTGNGYFPFDNVNYTDTESGYSSRQHFGMKFSTGFMMTGDGTYNEEDVEFRFSGDDDVWVFVDGKLILDIGGIHPKTTGSINFRTGEVKVDKVYSSVTGASYNFYDKYNMSLAGLADGQEHVLTVYYLERGAGESNCRIGFNLPAISDDINLTADIELKKVDETGEALTGAEFTLISQQDTAVSSAQISSEDGMVRFAQVQQGTYILEETRAPEGYELPKSRTWQVVVSKSLEGNASYIISAIDNSFILRKDGLYLIANQKEAQNQNVKTGKTASVIDYNSRIYQLDMTAKVSEVQSALTSNANAAMSTAIGGTLTGAAVTDDIDSRFIVTDAAGNALPDQSLVDDKSGILHITDHGSYVEWNNQTIGIDDQTKWSSTIYVKAKDDFLGGNEVMTNGAGSGVSVGGQFISFPQPTANVKLLNYSLTGDMETYFLGETIFGMETVNALNNGISMEGLRLSEEELMSLLTDGSFRRDYSYGDTNDKLGSINYTIENIGQGASYSEHEASFTGEGAENYKLTIAYDADIAAVREVLLRKHGKEPQVPVGDEVSAVSKSGEHRIDVVDGELTITKKFNKEYLENVGYTSETKELVDAHQSAVFDIYRYAADDMVCEGELTDTYRVVINYEPSRGEYQASKKIVGLKAGNYKVVEAEDWSWKYEQKSVKDTYEAKGDGVLFIGKKEAGFNSDSDYFGQTGTTKESNAFANISFENDLISTLVKWAYGDTCYVKNEF